MSASAVEFRAVDGKTSRCICGASAPGGLCPDFPACLPQTGATSFEALATRIYADLDVLHGRIVASTAHGGHNTRARSKALRAIADAKAAFRDAGVRR
jgi:hypothetical protein